MGAPVNLLDELERAARAADTVGDACLAEGARRRLAMLRAGPPGAGWAWLAAQGDEGAALALQAGKATP